MPRPSRAARIDQALLAAVDEHPSDLARVVAAQLGVSRQAVSTRINALIASGLLARSGTTRPRYSRGSSRDVTFNYRLAGLAEDLVWSRDIAPQLRGLPANVYGICQHGLTEMVNNTIDHSEGTAVTVRVIADRKRISLIVTDDGVGIFRKLSEHLHLPDERLALLELSKGKLTTDPSQHSGEGIFFTSRAFDLFLIVSGGLLFTHAKHVPDDWLIDTDSDVPGTSVLMSIRKNSNRRIEDVFAEYSSGPDEYAFAKTVVPVRLAKVGSDHLVSRSQAKRLLQRIDRFRTVVLDFSGIASIGQAFADEVFRVFAHAHPEVELIPTHAAPEVQQMINRARNLKVLS